MTVSPSRPEWVKISPHKYTILYTADDWKEHAPKKRKDHAGLTLSDQGVILINEDRLSESQMRDTLVHEIIHAALAIHCFGNLPGELPTDRHDLEEYFVLLLAPVMLGVLKDNPHVTKWLVSD